MVLTTWKLLQIATRALIVFTALTGMIYPLFIFAAAQLFMPHQANGSLVVSDNRVIGSKLIAQRFASDAYIHNRPSAVDYATIPSGASNLSATSAALLAAVGERQSSLGSDAPADLLAASASGLDPDISPEAAAFQVSRVAHARGLSPAASLDLKDYIRRASEGPQWGFMGRPRVNVLLLNIAIDRNFASKQK